MLFSVLNYHNWEIWTVIFGCLYLAYEIITSIKILFKEQQI
jgi:hypothetical protein